MPAATPREPLDAQTAVRLTDFARACKAAARAVSLYPNAHPAVATSLDRLVEAASRTVRSGPFTISVLPNTLLVGNRVPERADTAVIELAALLHDHLIGELQVLSAADANAWRTFLHLLGQPPIDVQAQGGISRLWAGGGGDHVRVREVDYAEVLRQRSAGLAAQWDTIIAHCLQDDTVHIDEQSLAALLEIADDAERLHDLVQRIEQEAAEGGIRVQAEALARLLRFVADAVGRRRPERLDQTLDTMARVAGRLSPEILLGILARRSQSPDESASDPVSQMIAHMTDDTIGGFVAQSVVERRGATERLAQAFQTLVPEEGRRPGVLGVARDHVAETPLGTEDDFPKLWKQTTDMLLSYRDEPFVSEAYARELSGARGHAAEVERISDDPPEQIASWLNTISDASIRLLDLDLLLDLLTIEQDAGQWDVVVASVVTHIDDLVSLGDFEAAEPLVSALAAEAGPRGRRTHKAAALSALDRLLHGQLMTSLVGHLRTIDDAGFDRVRRLCLALGPAAIRPLSEALAIEERGRAFRRLTDLLVAFGAAGREAVEQLKNSPNPAVRRTAIYLLREFGGSEALPELASLLDDAEPNIQREAIRAIALIGSADAHAVLQRALVSGSTSQRENIVNALGSMRDERAVPLFCHMVRSSEYRRTMRRAYLTAIDGLGAVGGPEAVEALAEALREGQWYAPFRTAALRRAAAGALRRVGSAEALNVLRDAAERGTRGVRAAAREQLARNPVRHGEEVGQP
jgi:HEAT repeat protein